MKLVKDENNKLQQAIQDLSHNISLVLSQQETNFLTYYQQHIKQIQGEFQILQTDIQEKEFDIKNNTYVKELEKERDWYKIEAIHLDKLVTKLKEENRYLNQRLMEVNDDTLSTKTHLKRMIREKDALENLLVKYGIEPNCNLEDVLLNSSQNNM